MFSKETYITRRQALKEKVGNGLLLFLGNNFTGMNYADNAYHFRQDSSFLYYFASDYEGLAAIIDIDNDNNTEFQTDVNVLSEFSFSRSEVYYCLPNVIRSNYKWWIDPVLISFRKFNEIFTETRKEET